MESVVALGVSILDPAVAFIEKFAFLGEYSHVVKLDAVDAQLLPVSASLGMDLALIKYTVSLFLVYPMAYILRKLPNTTSKHLFSLFGGVFLAQWIFGPDWIHTFVSSFVTYLICLILPKKYIGSVAFAWVMGYMTASHLYRMYTSYLSGIFDFTGTQMVLTMKLTSFAYNLYDGTYDKKRVIEGNYPEKDARVYKERKFFAITKLPNPIEFFGYVYCFTCLLAGPAFEYNDYAHSIDESVFHKEEADKDGKKTVKKVPSSVAPGLLALLIGVVCLVGHLVISASYPMKSVYTPAFVDVTPHLQRYGYLYIALFAERLKYYFAWKVAEGASILGGFGFEGYDVATGEPKGWKGVQNVDILGFELAPNVQLLSRAWNKRTQGWLERYTYLRCGKSLLITYFVSAIWHGLYPGFFIFFMSIPILSSIERLARAKINPILVPEYDGRDLKTYPKNTVGTLYWFFSWLFTTLVMNYLVQVFTMGSYERCMIALGSYKHAPHILLVVVYVILELLPAPKKSKGAAGDKKEK